MKVYSFKIGDKVVPCFDVFDRGTFTGSYKKFLESPYLIVVEGTTSIQPHGYIKVKTPCGQISEIYQGRMVHLSTELFQDENLFMM